MKYIIEDEARTFLDIILPSNTSIVQRDEMFKAYMAGFAEATNFHCFNITEMTDDDAMGALDDLHKQLHQFASKL